MPITVRHDPSAGSLARLAALSGLTQQQNVEAAREQQAFLQQQRLEAAQQRQNQQIRQRQEEFQAAQLQQQRELQAKPTLKEEGQAEAFAARQKAEALLPIQIQEMEERQRLEAEGWEERYSAKARQDISRATEAMQRIRAEVADGRIDPETGRRMLAEVAARRDGVTKEWHPPDPNKPPEEQVPGFMREDERTGDILQRKADGTWGVITPYEDTRAGVQQAQEHALKLEGLKQQGIIAKERRAYEIKLDEMEVPRLTEDGESTDTSRRLTEVEKRDKLRRFFPGTPVSLPGDVSSQVTGVTPQTTGAFDQVFEEMKGSLTRTKAEEGLPERVAMAQSFLREINRRGLGERGSPRILAAIQEALQIGAEYDAALRGQGR